MSETTKKKPTVRITEKQRAVAREIVENTKRETPLTKKEIMVKAGYNDVCAVKNQNKVFNSTGVQAALAEVDLNPNKLATRLNEAVDATQGTWFQGEYHTDNSPDHKVRLSAMNLLAEITGIKKMTVEQRNVNVNLEGQDLVQNLGL